MADGNEACLVVANRAPKVNGRAYDPWLPGELSNAIVDAIPPEWLCAAYPGLHDLALAQAVEKVAKERMRNVCLTGRVNFL